jgi:phage portal protein BeeE
LKTEVYHIKNDNDISNEVSGKSRMTSLFLDVETDQEARESNLAFFKNNQIPSSIIILDPGFVLDEDDEKDYKAKVKELFESGKYE